MLRNFAQIFLTNLHMTDTFAKFFFDQKSIGLDMWFFRLPYILLMLKKEYYFFVTGDETKNLL